jgi:tripartite-type tricarboxylate transporter receptor subunit TctC
MDIGMPRPCGTFSRRAVDRSVGSDCLSLAAPYAWSQPGGKVVRFLVGAPPGGSNDIFARAIGQRLSEALGQSVIVDNRPGANQMIAADLTAKAPADGNTLYMTSTSYTTGAAIQPKLPFDPVNRSSPA